jgi:hypothetical protein
VHVECESKSYTSNSRSNWNQLIVIQTLPKQHPGKTQNQGTTNNSCIGHCTHTKDSTNVKVQNIFHVRNNITCSTDYKYRAAATLYTLETCFVSGI